MNDPIQDALDNQPKRNPYAIWFVVLSFVAPVVLAYFMFYFVEVTSFTNRGEIFTPVVAIESLALKDESGSVLTKKDLAYKWRIYSFVGSSCNETCNKRLHEVRQMHISLGKNSHRILRVIVHLEKPDAALSELIKTEYPDALNMYGDLNSMKAAISNNAQLNDNAIYFTDPMGNMMMRFMQDQPIRDVHFDLRKLLKASQIG